MNRHSLQAYLCSRFQENTCEGLVSGLIGVTFWGEGLTPLNLCSLAISPLSAPTSSPRLSEYKSGISLHRGHLGGQRGQEAQQAYNPYKPISLAPVNPRVVLHRIIAVGGKSWVRPRLPRRPLMPQTTAHSWVVQNAPKTGGKQVSLKIPWFCLDRAGSSRRA